ncbi:MAG: RsmE family RNA methyltransferase [Patescibacteria group bacterium]
MRLHRFIGEFDLSKSEIEIKDSEIIKQVRNVLRLNVGDFLILSDGKGMEKETTITSLSKENIIVEVIKDIPLNEPTKKVSLYLAVLKKENFELAVQKAVECGVSEIIPIITERTVKTGLNKTRLEKIIKESCEQSGRGILPHLSETISFDDALQDGTKNEERVVFHFVDKQYESKKNTTYASIFIGPEGGFTEHEISLTKDTGYTVTSLGSLTLRAETAAMISTYRVVQNI